MDHAKTALSVLTGTLLGGNSLKIEFAKPAKPCKSLWVSGISQAVTKEVLEEQFMKFGKIEEFKFIRDRNTAFVDYFQLEDAVKALKNMKGKQIGGEQIRVDFLRSHPIRKDQLADQRDARDGQFLSRGMGHVDTPLMQHDAMRNYYEPSHSGAQRQQFHSLGGQRGDGPPTNVLLVCYPTNVEIDEHMLHNAMILFGEIESLKSFPLRHCAFVEFRSMDEARRAKEGLQGRLFNDPRILITYSSNELAPGKDYPEFYAGLNGPRPNRYSELPFQPAHMDVPNARNIFSRYGSSGGILGPMRPFGPPGTFAGPEIKDSTGHHKLPDANDVTILGAPNWRTSPAPGVLPSPSLGTKRPIKPVSAPWDVIDDQLPDESKRSRIEAALPVSNFSLPSMKMNDRDLQSNQLYKHGSRASHDMHTGGTGQGYLEKDYVWRGLIAKGGNPVCCARCVPIGKGIESEIPEVVNCSARTGLDMLTKHYADAVGFDIVFFLPDCEEDFASYTEFLNYLGGRDRAGVARFDNGTTLFLVPPSDFLSKVLKITGPPRLYGVVLKFPQDAPGSNSAQSQPFLTSHYMDRQQRVSQGEYSGISENKEKLLLADHDNVGSLSHLTQLASAPRITSQPVAAVNVTSGLQSGVMLTPELIATLSSLLPAGSKSSGLLSAPLPPGGSSSAGHHSPASYELDVGPPQGWTPNRQETDQIAYPSQQMQEQYNPQHQVVQHHNYTTGLNMPYKPVHGVSAEGHVREPPYYLPQPGGVSRPLSNFGINSQSEHHVISSQFNRQHQNEVAQNTIAHGTSSLGSYSSSAYAQEAQPSMIAPTYKENPELPNKVPQHQAVNSGPSQEMAGVEVDKNQRYQSTLQFAANLLLQIQQRQQQQPTGSQSGQGSANNN